MQNTELQILWLSDSLGLAVNQKTPKGSLPITSYYFWPISEAWEQIRFELDSKPWIPEKERIQLLNVIVEVMNQWQKSRTLSNENTQVKVESLTLGPNVDIVGLS